MKILFIACGNPLRGDDGAAFEVLRRIAPAPGRRMRAVQQLTPELADEMAGFDCVVFLDADATSAGVTIEPVGCAEPLASLANTSLTHAATSPGEIVALSRALYGFVGGALLCRLPARDFAPGRSLSADALQFVQQATEKIGKLL